MESNIKYVEESDSASIWRWIRRIGLVITILVASGMAGCPVYLVWQQGLVGEGELRRAEQNRKIRVQEGIAAEEAAKHLAQAEVERARGVAQANEIIAKGLGGPEGYLRYLWIHSLETTKGQVIYVPTEANLPILEATRNRQ